VALRVKKSIQRSHEDKRRQLRRFWSFEGLENDAENTQMVQDLNNIDQKHYRTKQHNLIAV